MLTVTPFGYPAWASSCLAVVGSAVSLVNEVNPWGVMALGTQLVPAVAWPGRMAFAMLLRSMAVWNALRTLGFVNGPEPGRKLGRIRLKSGAWSKYTCTF